MSYKIKSALRALPLAGLFATAALRAVAGRRSAPSGAVRMGLRR